MDFDESNPLDYLKWGAIFIVIIGILFGIGVGVKVLFFPAAVVNEVVDAKKAVNGYEWYEAQNAEINATVNKINGFYKMHPTIEGIDKINLDGMVQYLESVVGDYNGRSKMVTRNLWKASNLPYQLRVEYGERSISVTR